MNEEQILVLLVGIALGSVLFGVPLVTRTVRLMQKDHAQRVSETKIDEQLAERCQTD